MVIKGHLHGTLGREEGLSQEMFLGLGDDTLRAVALTLPDTLTL